MNAKIILFSDYFKNLLLILEKYVKKIKISKNSPKIQLLLDFQKLLTKMFGRPRAFRNWQKKLFERVKSGKKKLK